MPFFFARIGVKRETQPFFSKQTNKKTARSLFATMTMATSKNSNKSVKQKRIARIFLLLAATIQVFNEFSYYGSEHKPQRIRIYSCDFVFASFSIYIQIVIFPHGWLLARHFQFSIDNHVRYTYTLCCYIHHSMNNLLYSFIQSHFIVFVLLGMNFLFSIAIIACDVY